MSEKQREQIQWWLEVVFKLGTPVSVLMVGAVTLWLNANYATRAELRELTAQVGVIREALIRMERGAETDTRHAQMLADHESRLRVVEARR